MMEKGGISLGLFHGTEIYFPLTTRGYWVQEVAFEKLFDSICKGDGRHHNQTAKLRPK